MRLEASFVLLLIIAATATSMVLRQLAPASEGDGTARVLLFGLAPVAIVAIILLGRIVLRVHEVRARGRQR